MLSELLKGEIRLSADLIVDMVSGQMFYEWRNNRKTLVHILLIVIIAAVFTNFSNVFQNQQTGEISFYVLYLLLITICLTSFQTSAEVVGKKLELLTAFMRALGPVYFLAAAFAIGGKTSVMFYNLVLFLIYLVELLVLNFLLPLLHIYMVIKLLNYISPEDYLSKFAEFIEFIVEWTLKALLAAVVGLNLVQGLLGPAFDSLKRGIFSKGIEAVPAIGDAAGGTVKMLLGTAVLIKNGIGAAGAVICIVICVVPAAKLFVMTFLYKLLAAMVQPVSDKRIIGCIASMGEGNRLLLRVVFTTGVLFLLTIAIVAATTPF